MSGSKKKAVIVFARMSSKRLPGKALLPLANGYLLIELVIKQLQTLRDVAVIVATSSESEDDILAQYAKSYGIEVFRGDLQNVAKRTMDCIHKFQLDYFARINGDSPFVNAALICNGFERIETENLDLVTNIFPRTFPYGYSLEVMRSTCFVTSYPQFSAHEQEHITSYFYNHISSFKYVNLTSDIPVDESIRLVVDTSSDYIKLNQVFTEYPDIHKEPLSEIIKAYKNSIGA